jgi:N4-gp56 family major capsid protein
MPDMSGVAMQIFDYSKMAANTTPATEGTPGSGQALTQNTATINLSNYVDYVSYSNKVKFTAISDTVAEGSALLSYRGALSVDTVIYTTLDTAANSTTLDRIDVNDGTYMTASLARKAYWQLRSFDTKPKANGLMFGMIHSLSAYDMVNDSTAAGWTELPRIRLSSESRAQSWAMSAACFTTNRTPCRPRRTGNRPPTSLITITWWDIRRSLPLHSARPT